MRRNFLLRAAIVASGALLGLVLPQSARAASIVCTAGVGFGAPISDNVTPSTGCEIGGANNDFLGGTPSQHQVNADTMFGFNDWVFAEKAFESAQAIDIGLSITGNPISGTWAVNDIWSTLNVSELMLVFKGGSSKQPGQYVGYLIADGAIAGSYLTPFLTTGQGSGAAVSHVSAYIRQSTTVTEHELTPVPEPTSLVLFGTGAALLARRLRRGEKRR
jgi:hypothetical protein